MMEGAEEVPEDPEVLPAAPMMKGKKLGSKTITGRLLVSL